MKNVAQGFEIQYDYFSLLYVILKLLLNFSFVTKLRQYFHNIKQKHFTKFHKKVELYCMYVLIKVCLFYLNL